MVKMLKETVLEQGAELRNLRRLAGTPSDATGGAHDLHAFEPNLDLT